MNCRKKHWLTITACQAVAFFSIAILSTSLSFGQGNVDQFPTLPDTGNVDNGNVTNNNNGNNNGGNTTNVTDGGETDVNVADNAVNINVTDDQRNQGFIGSNSVRIQESGFIGAPGEIAGPGLADDATLGGGVNNQGGSSVSIGTGGGRGGFNAAADNGFTVPRRSVRARLVPSFYSPPRPSQQVVSRFTNHFQQQPSAWQTGNNYSINIQNRTAFVNGTVGTRADSERLVRQLRLEPGVYKIVNQLQILN